MSVGDHSHSGGSGHHGHSHHHRGGNLVEARRQDRIRLWAAFGMTAIIAAAEVVGGFVSNSLALISDAGHMLTDLSAFGLSLLALWFSSKPANVRKTYGYHRLEILSTLVNGLLLLVITVIIAFQAVARLQHPVPVKVAPLLGVACIGLVANVASMLFLRHPGSMNVRSAFLHVMGDALSSLGVIIAALIILFTGWTLVDPIISLMIAVVIVIGAYRLLRDAVDVLLEATPEHVDLEAVRTLLAEVAGVVAVHDLHVWTLTSGVYALSAHLVVVDPMVCNNDAILSAVKDELFERFGIDHTTIQIESETYSHLGEVH